MESAGLDARALHVGNERRTDDHRRLKPRKEITKIKKKNHNDTGLTNDFSTLVNESSRTPVRGTFGEKRFT